MLNEKLVAKVRQTLLDEPDRVYMDVFISKADDIFPPNLCGTVGCIAGHACMLATPTQFEKVSGRVKPKKKDMDGLRPWNFPFGEVACDLLGLEQTREDGNPLFYFHGESVDGFDDLRVKLFDAKPGTKKYAKIVVQALDRAAAKQRKLDAQASAEV